jgi:hypothetical protein
LQQFKKTFSGDSSREEHGSHDVLARQQGRLLDVRFLSRSPTLLDFDFLTLNCIFTISTKVNFYFVRQKTSEGKISFQFQKDVFKKWLRNDVGPNIKNTLK